MSGSILPLREVPFSEDHNAVLRHLSTGVLPPKFAYTGSDAYAHRRFSSSGGHARVGGGDSLEGHVLRALKPQAGDVGQLVGIGPGDGRRTAVLLASLASLKCRWHRYLAIDASATLLSMACDVVRAAVPRMAVSGATWDIELDTSDAIAGWRRGSGPLTACLFGHTLGKLESPVEALRRVREALRPGDRLVAGLAMRPDADLDVLDGYRTADSPFGYSDDAVVGTAISLRSTRVGDAFLPAGCRLRCFRARGFTTEEVEKTFTDAGWLIEDKRFDRTGDHSIVTAIRREGKSYAE